MDSDRHSLHFFLHNDQTSGKVRILTELAVAIYTVIALGHLSFLCFWECNNIANVPSK